MPVHHRLRFLTFPMRASRLCSLWSDMRPLRFRRVPFGRDVAFDPGGATASRITMPHILPSTVPSVSASATLLISWLNPPPHPITVYASHPPLPTTTQHSLPGGVLPPYRGRSFTGRIASASPDAPEPEVRIHLPPAESQQQTGGCNHETEQPLAAELCDNRLCVARHPTLVPPAEPEDYPRLKRSAFPHDGSRVTLRYGIGRCHPLWAKNCACAPLVSSRLFSRDRKSVV